MEYGLSGLPKKERERALPFGRIEAFGKKFKFTVLLLLLLLTPWDIF